MSDSPHPTEIRLREGGRTLLLSYPDGGSFELSAELLRVFSPSSEVQGYHHGRPVLQVGKAGVAITAVEPVGAYALRISFDDGHRSGLYTWPRLRDLALNRERHFSDYLARLAAAGQSRGETM